MAAKATVAAVAQAAKAVVVLETSCQRPDVVLETSCRVVLTVGVPGLESATVGVELQLPSPSPEATSPRAKSSPECAHPVGNKNRACQEACRKRIPCSKTRANKTTKHLWGDHLGSPENLFGDIGNCIVFFVSQAQKTQ